MIAVDAVDSVEDVARALIGRPVKRLQQVGGGRNSRVYRVEAGNETFALKQYPSRQEDPRDRLGAEVSALQLMTRNGLTCVPRVVAVDKLRNFVLLSWIDGALASNVGADDIDQALAFLSQLRALTATAAMTVFPLASEACLSGSEIDRQIRRRSAQLSAIEGEPALREFVETAYSAALTLHLAEARRKLADCGQSFDGELVQDRQTLVPSDFGFHNALRQSNGRLSFIDFEYFGWDDPVKLVADVLLHPGTPLSPELRRRFRAGAEGLYGLDPTFSRRLDALYPLFGLRWVLILLNEFHPERWRRRVLAGAAVDWGEAKARQLEAAQHLLAQLPIGGSI
jgi:Phosphotransferase enzyme family